MNLYQKPFGLSERFNTGVGN